MTKMLGREHFPQKHFCRLVTTAFPAASFGSFEAHYVPRTERLRGPQRVVEEGLEWIPGLGRFLSYNFAVAPRRRAEG